MLEQILTKNPNCPICGKKLHKTVHTFICRNELNGSKHFAANYIYSFYNKFSSHEIFSYYYDVKIDNTEFLLLINKNGGSIRFDEATSFTATSMKPPKNLEELKSIFTKYKKLMVIQ